MLIKEFNDFLHEARSSARTDRIKDFSILKKGFTLQLMDIYEGLEDQDNKTAHDLKKVINLFKSPKSTEIELAKSFIKLSEIFAQADVEDEQVADFVDSARRFYDQAKLEHLYEQKRHILKEQLSAEEQDAHDSTLFAKEGMMYSLTYHLAVYKALESLQTEQEKKQYLESEDIDFGFGKLNGLKQDFMVDEVLKKFFLMILDDDVRERLVRQFYQCKKAFMELDDIDKQIIAFRKLIYAQLREFKQLGFEHIKSEFFKPYGENPTADELLERFKT